MDLSQWPSNNRHYLSVLWFILVVAVSGSQTNSANILFLFPISPPSECEAVSTLGRALHARGHNVTMICSGFSASSQSVNNRSEIAGPSYFQTHRFLQPLPFTDYFGSEEDSILDHRRMYKRMIPYLLGFKSHVSIARCHELYQSPEFWNVAVRKDYDLVFIPFVFHDCLFGLVAGKKYIVYNTIPFTGDELNFWGVRMPSSVIPLSIAPFSDRMTLFQRMGNLLLRVGFVVGYTLGHETESQGVYRQYLGEHLTAIGDIKQNASMIFSNSHFAVSYSRPLTPDVLEIGGYHCKRSPDRLPLELESLFESAVGGVIYFSFGSMFKFSHFPPKLQQSFLSAFSRLKETVVMVSDVDDWEGMGQLNRSSNVIVTSFVPQQSVLAHKNTRLFITHGGAMSYIESVWHGVPTIVLPVCGDQAFFAEHAVANGNGIKLELLDLDENLLHDSITDVLQDRSYYRKARRLSRLLRDQSPSPLEKAVFWSEFILNYGPTLEMQSPASRTMSTVQYYSLDNWLLLAGILLVLVTFISKYSTFAAESKWNFVSATLLPVLFAGLFVYM